MAGKAGTIAGGAASRRVRAPSEVPPRGSVAKRKPVAAPTASSSGFGHVSYSELRQHLKEHLDAVSDSRAPLVVTRRNREPVVMLALSEYESLQETLHLLRDPANAEHLLQSIAEAETDRFFETNLDE